MRITKIVKPFALSNTNALGSGGGIIDSSGGDGQFPGSGQVPVATGSNGWAWGSNVQRIFSNTSNALLGPFVNFQNGSGISFSVSSNTLTIAATGGGGSTAYLPWFDVHDYGAVGDGTTDDTTAIQSAMTAAETAGGGNVLFRRGKVYKVGGALQDTGRSNAQLLLPRIKYGAGGNEQITIHLMGEVGPADIASVVGSVVLPDNGPVIKSTLATGTGAVIGAWGPSGSLDDFTMLKCVVSNLIIRTVADPTNSALDLSHVATVELHNVQVDAGEMNAASISSQTTSTSYGVKLPGNNNGASTHADIVNVIGFYNAYLMGEHTVADNIAAWATRVGYTFPFGYHASHIGRLAFYHAKVGLKFTGDHYFSIDQVNVEHADTGTWTPTYDIDDASSYGHGHLTWHTVLANTGVDHTFTVNGATDIYRLEVGDNPFAGGSSSPLTTKGDLFGYSTTNARFAVGSNGTVPIADSAQAVGLRYSVNAPSGELLISDTPAGSPLVFGDILQNELQDDLLYGDL